MGKYQTAIPKYSKITCTNKQNSMIKQTTDHFLKRTPKPERLKDPNTLRVASKQAAE